jgi:transcriptional regulator with XRE-family HTH domain
MTTALEASKVRAIRGALGLSVTQTAAVLHVVPSTVSRWEMDGGPDSGLGSTVFLAIDDRFSLDSVELVGLGERVRLKLRLFGALSALRVLLDALA